MNALKLCLFFVLASTVLAHAQTKAITRNGRNVLLFDDGTWKFEVDTISSIGLDDSIVTDPDKFEHDKHSTLLVKSKDIGIGVYIDPEEWIFSHGSGSNPREYEFETKDHSCSASIVTESFEVRSFQKMIKIQMGKVYDYDPNAQLLAKEFRIVNGKHMLFMKIKWTLKSMNFISLGYFYSNEDGTVQFIASTLDKSLNTHQVELERLLNGLIIIKPGSSIDTP